VIAADKYDISIQEIQAEEKLGEMKGEELALKEKQLQLYIVRLTISHELVFSYL